jgi:hypothetical protein
MPDPIFKYCPMCATALIQMSSLLAQRKEVSELALFSWDELPTFAFPVHQRILRDWKKLNSH